MKIGLVLGAGGPVGHGWHAGVLRAMVERTGWDPREAELVLGTSAGAQVAALLRAGMSAPDLMARLTGAPMSAAGRAIAEHYVRPEARTGPLRLRPGAPGYIARSLRRPWTLRPGPLAAAVLPRGRVDREAMAQGFRRLFGSEWPEAPLWITAVRMGCGTPVAFGHPEAPLTDVGSAVVSSGSVPGIYRPVEIQGDHYVDGGMVSATHLELLRHADLDLVIVSSPLSIFGPLRRALRREVKRLGGPRVVALEPRASARRIMGWNPLDAGRAPAVAQAAFESVGADLEGLL